MWTIRVAGSAVRLGALACLALLGARIACAFSFTTPWLITTSGTEEGPLYSVWKVVHGQGAYADPAQIPYVVSYYNWAFYYLYGGIARAALALFHAGDVWLPTICRLVTLTFALGATVLVARLLPETDAAPGDRFSRWTWRGAVGVAAVLQPLAGFWVMTTRADIGALFFQLAGLWLVLRFFDRGRRWLIFAAAALYLAWSFKQISVEVLGGTLLTLLLQRRWTDAALLFAVFAALVAATFAVGGPLYLANVTFQGQSSFSPLYSAAELLAAMIKQPLFPVALAVLLWIVERIERNRPNVPARDLLWLLVAGCALAEELLTACKGGSTDIYFLPATVLALLAAFHFADRLPRTLWQAGLAAAGLALVLEIALVFTGRGGMIDRRGSDASMRELTRNLAPLPGPIFVIDAYGNVPWVQPHAPFFVYDPSFGRAFAAPLLREGYFATVVLRSEDDFAPTEMADYEVALRSGDYIYYQRR